MIIINWSKLYLVFFLLLALNAYGINKNAREIRCCYFAYESPNDSTTQTKNYVNKNRLIFSCLSVAALNVAAYQPFKETWWQEERIGFHFYHGWQRTKGDYDFKWKDSYCGHIDKLGHIYSSKMLSEQITDLSRWIGFSHNTSHWIGPILSSLMLLEIEVYDGFFKEWGFSLADFAANEVGAFAPMLRDKIPYADNFQFKFSYSASKQPNTETAFIKDYAGMTYWLSWNVRSVMPAKFKTFYPAWLNVALGYGISKQAHGEIELYLSPDINWEKMPIGNSDWTTFVKRLLNYFHFPCITYQIQPKSQFYLLYF